MEKNKTICYMYDKGLNDLFVKCMSWRAVKAKWNFLSDADYEALIYNGLDDTGLWVSENIHFKLA